MKEDLALKDFDLLGMIELEDVSGIEDLVTAIGNGNKTYISRAYPFWHQYTCTEASNFREELKAMLPFVASGGKKAFVILDYMANLSGKVYFQQIVRAIDRPDSAKVDKAKACLKNDIKNLINLFEGKKIVIDKRPENTLPYGDDLIAKRNIECNNHALLYTYAKSFNPPKDYKILNTGLGGIFIGPYLNNIYGVEWTNMYKSKYINERNPCENQDFMRSLIRPEIFENKNILLLDDNSGTGDTIREIKLKLLEHGYNVKIGAVQYNWINFFRVGIGEKNIPRFDPTTIDYLTYFNYPGHKFIDHAIGIICGNRNLNGPISLANPYDGTIPGQNYLDYKLKKHYFPENPGIVSLKEKGVRYSGKSGFPLIVETENGEKYNKYIMESSKKLMQSINEFIENCVIKNKNSSTFGE